MRWSWARVVRVTMGALGIPTAIYADSWFLGLLSAAFLIQGLLALGCENGACAVPGAEKVKTNQRINHHEQER